MNSSGAMRPSAESAAAALRAAQAAENAARESARSVPAWYPAAHGLLLAAAMSGFGLARLWPGWQGWILAAALLCAGAFLVVTWRVQRASGVAPWFARRERGTAWHAWVLPLIPFAAGLVGALLFGGAGAFTGFGVVAGAVSWLQAGRERTGAREAS
uniref:Transmembrane protein n=1 Tax=Streptomyces sp. NBC_01393 TaxID=2903851 RepID=A0AAU3I7G5_9ACTN